jgi:hypothetical protein
MILDTEKNRYIITDGESQYYIQVSVLARHWYDEAGYPLNDTPVHLLYKFIKQLFKKSKHLFIELKYIIQYTYKGDRKHSSYNNYYDALRVYHKMAKHGIYEDIETNFDIDESIIKSFDMYGAYKYNELLKNNISYEILDNINVNNNINFMD